tara:strand:+ start:5964 stop:6188 length:225 start_codon:yes stop_codon:yes gene_type:complete
MANKEPLLTEIDLMNPAVAKIIKYFDDRLTKLRIDNDKFDADIHIRGRIAEIKAFNRAVKPKQPKETSSIKSAI